MSRNKKRLNNNNKHKSKKRQKSEKNFLKVDKNKEIKLKNK